jgi:SAM-dependent methyltransferase
MSQRTSNLYHLITIPAIYKGLMSALGAERARQRLVRELYAVPTGAKVLDVGCGPGSIYPYLPAVDYTGIDLNPKHVEHARALYGERARFILGDASRDLQEEAGTFDLVVVSALLHHLDDYQALGMLSRLCELLKPGARLVTFDNVWLERQNPIAWALNKLDSGRNVRFASEYSRLVADLPVLVEERLYHNLLRIPYDHFSMILTKS